MGGFSSGRVKFVNPENHSLPSCELFSGLDLRIFEKSSPLRYCKEPFMAEPVQVVLLGVRSFVNAREDEWMEFNPRIGE